MPPGESDIVIRMRVLAAEVYKARVYAEYMMRQMFPTTAEGEYLDLHAAQRSLTRKSGTKAEGRVTFGTDSEEHGAILIPAGTEVCTADGTLRYVTVSAVTLNTGESTVGADVIAAEPGGAYNAVAGAVNVIVTPTAGIDSVSNTANFSGGSDTESDRQLRERIADSYVNISNGTNAAYYRGVAISVDGVYSAGVIGGGRGAGTVDVYVCAQGSSVPAAVIAQIQSLMDEARELNVDVRVQNASPVQINLYIRLKVEDGYDFSDVSAQVRSAVSDYINSLGIGHDVLLSRIGDIVYHIKGVSDFRFLESYGSDEEIAQSEYAVSGTLTVAEDS